MSAPSDVDRYRYLWDGSEPGWVLHGTYAQSVDLSLQFDVSGPSARELVAIRKTVPAFQERPLSQVIAHLRGCPSLALGEFDVCEGRRIAAACRAHGLAVLERFNDRSRHLLRNELTGMGLLIEDADLAKRVCDAARRHGIPDRCTEA